jgi:hypothetical protein
MKPHRLRPADRLGVRPLLLVAAALAGATLFAAAAQAKDTILMGLAVPAAPGETCVGGPGPAPSRRRAETRSISASSGSCHARIRCGPARARRGAPAGGGIRAAPRSARADPPM